ncbi:MFS transporter [Sphingomonas metalli]|uniref:MFS transporter n=1 Tax=Sphingomonas metalli TaxID=1779358 RepID=A0A916WTS5_9SPHN|nr:MFS transporter [Sphingomonas metalli]GGB29012.1 MFS transporter [Sphingomonas metalli]
MVRRFAVPLLPACGLANAATVVGWLPLLNLLLALRIDRLAPDMRIALLAISAVVGGIAASVANILFGWLSDVLLARGIARRAVIAAGLVAVTLAYALLTAATTPLGIVAGVVAVQVSFNAVLAPFLALLADEVPEADRGKLGGLLSLGQPIAAAILALMVSLPAISEAARLLLLPVLIALGMLPFLLRGSDPLPPEPRPAPVEAAASRRALALAIAARLLVQAAGSVLGLYLFYYLESVSGPIPQAELAARVGTLLTIGYVIPVPIALLLGHLSDRIQQRRLFLVAAGLVAALGMTVMAAAGDWRTAIAAFYVYTAGSAIFLALHIGFSFRLLPDPAWRGRDLGLYNLSNTIPAVIGPILTWWLATPQNFSPLLIALAALTAAGGLLSLAMRPPPCQG